MWHSVSKSEPGYLTQNSDKGFKQLLFETGLTNALVDLVTGGSFLMGIQAIGRVDATDPPTFRRIVTSTKNLSSFSMVPTIRRDSQGELTT